MRLVCPNCDARYEVPDDAIPEAGRDVQCANCGHAWYQMSAGALTNMAEPAEVAAMPEVAEMAPAEAAPIEAAAPPVTEALADRAPAQKIVSEYDDASIDDAPPLPRPTHPAVSDYGVDDSVLAILREEAEREVKARQDEVRPLETQGDLGIIAAETPLQKRAAMLKAEDAAAKPSARRDLLPDVEEINSTLSPSESASDDEAEGTAPADVMRGRNSFRSGFLMMVLVALIGLVAYLAAPRLSAQLPGLTGPLTAYVSFVDVIRLQLDGLMQSATVALTGEAS